MNTKKIEKFIQNFGLQALTIAAGLILLLNPDGATALVTKIIGWGLVIGAAIRLIRLATTDRLRWGMDAFLTGAALCLGVILLARPLILADLIGRFFGILLLMEGLRNLRAGGLRLGAVLTTLAGLLLMFIPRTLTNTLLGVCGIVLVFIGIVNLVEQLRDVKRLRSGSAPAGIIDAEN